MTIFLVDAKFVLAIQVTKCSCMVHLLPNILLVTFKGNAVITYLNFHILLSFAIDNSIAKIVCIHSADLNQILEAI